MTKPNPTQAQAQKLILRWVESARQMDSEPNLDTMSHQILEAILTEAIQNSKAEGLEMAAKECLDHKSRRSWFLAAYHAACTDLNVILAAMASRVKKGEYEHPVTYIEDFINKDNKND